MLLSSTVQDWIITRIEGYIIGSIGIQSTNLHRRSVYQLLTLSHQAFGTDIWIFWDRYLDLLGRSTNLGRRSISDVYDHQLLGRIFG